MIVCNRTGVDGSFDLRHAESVVVDRGRRLATLTADESTLFLLECAVNDGHITRCDVTPVRLAPMLIDPDDGSRLQTPAVEQRERLDRGWRTHSKR
jgi:hypothetical protein